MVNRNVSGLVSLSFCNSKIVKLFYLCSMQKIKSILSFVLLALVLSISFHIEGMAYSDISKTERNTASCLSNSTGLKSLFILPTDIKTNTPLSFQTIKPVFLLVREVFLSPAPYCHSTIFIAYKLSLQTWHAAYIIYPFHDFL